MSLAEQLRAELDESFGGEPPDRPVEARLAAGHRALRRRRAAEAMAACGLVVALGTAYLLGSPGAQRDASRHIASDPSATASATSTWQDDTPIRYVDGAVEIRPGVVVHEHVENPYEYRAPRTSDAFDLTFRGQRMWILAEADAGGSGFWSTEPSDGWASFADWVADQVALNQGRPGGDGWPRTMRLTDDGRVVPTGRTTVLQRTDDPRLGAGFAPPGTTTGAAVVRVAGTRSPYFVVWRVAGGELDVITTPPRDVGGAGLEELLQHARGQYESGEGLR